MGGRSPDPGSAAAEFRAAAGGYPGSRRSSDGGHRTAGHGQVPSSHVTARQPGVLLDYILINSTQTNFVFKSDTTYYATNYVALYGTTTLEGGAIAKGIKWDGGVSTGSCHRRDVDIGKRFGQRALDGFRTRRSPCGGGYRLGDRGIILDHCAGRF